MTRDGNFSRIKMIPVLVLVPEFSTGTNQSIITAHNHWISVDKDFQRLVQFRVSHALSFIEGT